jgi:general stress protein YciG
MSGTKEGSAKAAATNIRRHGKDFYKRIGHLGGSSPKTRPAGFATMSREAVSAAGRKGGKVTAKMRWNKDV